MKKYLKIISITFVLACTLVPALGFAQNPPDGGVGSGDPAQQNFQLVPCGTADKPCDFNQLLVLFNRIIRFLLWLSIPLILGMILYTGFKYLTANGDPGKLADAKKMFIPVAIGMFWVLGAYLVVYTILDKLVADRIGGVDKKDIILLNINK